MTPEQYTVLRELRNAGYAVVVFTPEELRGANINRVQDRLCELGWDVIDCLATEPAEDMWANE